MESSNNDVEEQVMLVTDDGSIVIDENTTFVDSDGNPVIVNQTNEGGKIEFIFQEGSVATTEKILSNDSQDQDSSKHGESLTVSNDLLEETKNPEEKISTIDSQECSTELSLEREDSSSMSNDLLEAARKSEEEQTSKRKRQDISNGTTSVRENILVFENKGDKQLNPPQGPIKVKYIPEGTIIDDLTCQYCLKKCGSNKKKLNHYRDVHKVTKTNPNQNIKCVECNMTFVNVNRLIDHLKETHKLKMDIQELTFPNMNGETIFVF